MLRPVIEDEVPVFRCSSKAETVMKNKVLQHMRISQSVKIKAQEIKILKEHI